MGEPRTRCFPAKTSGKALKKKGFFLIFSLDHPHFILYSFCCKKLRSGPITKSFLEFCLCSILKVIDY